jgi:ribosomal protein S12 methylthiotransferase accessory factor
MAMRPNARAISVAQGKGLDEDSARASALMEALEVAQAETPDLAVTSSSYARLSKQSDVARPSLLPRVRSVSSDSEIDWVEGRDLASGRSIFVPFELVHTDFTRPPPLTFFRSSNGLASGNHRLEAVISGLCETIERDATSSWNNRTPEEKAERRLRLESVRDRDCRALLERLRECEMDVSVWNTTTDVGVACFICRITEALQNQRSSLGAFWGAGCHLDRAIALSRAITEAAQSRLTYIAGTRDDMHRRLYLRTSRRLFDEVLDRWEQACAGTKFSDVPSCATDTLEDDLDCLLRRLEAAGLHKAIEVDLSGGLAGLFVARIIVLGLESHDPSGRLIPCAKRRVSRVAALA